MLKLSLKILLLIFKAILKCDEMNSVNDLFGKSVMPGIGICSRCPVFQHTNTVNVTIEIGTVNHG